MEEVQVEARCQNTGWIQTNWESLSRESWGTRESWGSV